MRSTLTPISLAAQSSRYRTGGLSEKNGNLGFQPGFIDRETEAVHLSRFRDGRLAPCHLLDGLPAELVVARNDEGRVTCVKASLVSGFMRDDRFYTRDEAAAMLTSVEGFDESRATITPLRKAA